LRAPISSGTAIFFPAGAAPPIWSMLWPDFFGPLEDLNASLRAEPEWKLQSTPGHLR
jgi:hypothetical protein